MSAAGVTRQLRRLHGASPLLCGLLLCASLQAAAATTATAASAPAMPVPVAVAWADFDWSSAQGVLFRVRSPQPGSVDSVFFGTIHIGTPEELGLDMARVRSAVAGQRTLINEVNGTTPWESRYDRYRFLADGQQLAGLIGAAEFTELGVLLPKHKPADLNRLKPWVAMTLLEEGAERPTALSIDRRVEDIAREQGLRLVHLETLEDQLAALDCAPSTEYGLVLKQRLADPQQLREDSGRSLAFYRQGDLLGWLADVDAMQGLDEQARAVEQQARECLLEQRNARWIEELEPLLREGGCFVAVGAIHLTGPDGLLAGLARRGFEIRAQAW